MLLLEARLRQTLLYFSIAWIHTLYSLLENADKNITDKCKWPVIVNYGLQDWVTLFEWRSYVRCLGRLIHYIRYSFAFSWWSLFN